MSRWEKFTLATSFILLLLGIIHLYRLQSTVSGKSRHLFLQPPILPAVVEGKKSEYRKENRSSLIVSDTSIPDAQTDYPSSESTASEDYTTSASALESNLVVGPEGYRPYCGFFFSSSFFSFFFSR